jgi:hypothetical protein
LTQETTRFKFTLKINTQEYLICVCTTLEEPGSEGSVALPEEVVGQRRLLQRQAKAAVLGAHQTLLLGDASQSLRVSEQPVHRVVPGKKERLER